MAIEKRTFPHELLLRFSSGQAHERNLVGTFEGAHYVVMEVLCEVDERDGKQVIVPAAPPRLLPARPVNRDEIEPLCGSLAANFDAGLVAERAAHAATRDQAAQAVAAAEATIGRLTSLVAQRDAEAAQMQREIAEAAGRIDQLVAQLAGQLAGAAPASAAAPEVAS